MAPDDTSRALADGGASPPNVVVFICDDLAYGSLGCLGDPLVETPHIDAFYDEAARFPRCYGGPLCAPARASLQTGRYYYRTGVLHTSIGHALMHPDEITFAELLGEVGYDTCHSGTWHLGDNYPLRPHDQGYDEALYHLGSGIGYWADGSNSYRDPDLHHNGTVEAHDGLAAAAFTQFGTDFIRDRSDAPFVTHIATDAPTPPISTVTDEYADPYRELGLTEDVCRYYGLISLIDECFGQVLDTLEATGNTENTIVVFTGDHGPTSFEQPIHRAGLRSGSGNVYESEVRVPLFVRWPDRFAGGRDIDALSHLSDLFPTFASACDVPLPNDRTIDGRNLLPAIEAPAETDWSDRRVYVQMTRTDVPERYRNSTVIGERYKLVNGVELYDLAEDPGEQVDVAARYPEIVADLRAAYEDWYEEMEAERGFQPPRIVIGSPHEDPSTLSRNDWLGPDRNGKSDDDIGYWEVDVDRGGSFEITVNHPSVGDTRFEPGEQWGTVHFRCGDVHRSHRVVRNVNSWTFADIHLDPGPARLEAWVRTKESVPYGEAPAKKGARSLTVSFQGEE